MANKQQRTYKKLSLATKNNGDHPLIAPIQHGPDAFLPSCTAIERLKKRGSKSWKISKRHPNNVEIGKR